MGVDLACRADVSNLNVSPENVATTGNHKAWKKKSILYLRKNKFFEIKLQLENVSNPCYTFKYLSMESSEQPEPEAPWCMEQSASQQKMEEKTKI